MPNDFDENGNMRRAQIFPSGIDKIKQALGIVPPAMIYFVSSSQPGSIPGCAQDANKDVDLRRHDDVTRMRAEMDAVQAKYDMPELFQQFSKGYDVQSADTADGPDMNEVDAALETIERMEVMDPFGPAVFQRSSGLLPA